MTSGGVSPFTWIEGREVVRLECQFGVTRHFGLTDMGYEGLVSGWSEPERSHVWNDGYDAILALSFPLPASGVRAEFVLEPFIGEGIEAQDLTVFANGFRLGFWRVKSRAEFSCLVELYPFQLVSVEGIARADFAFHSPGSVSPVEAYDNPDERLLGFCFRRLVLNEVELGG